MPTSVRTSPLHSQSPSSLVRAFEVMPNTADSIRQFVIEHFLFGQAGDLSDEASFLEKGIIDSTGVLELVAHVESQYGIKVNDDELLPDNLDSIDALCAFIARKRSSAGQPTT